MRELTGKYELRNTPIRQDSRVNDDGERTTFEAVAERAQAESALSRALTKLFAIAGRYPRLRVVESVQLLQEQLTSTENRIAYERQFYNDEVMKFNTAHATLFD